MKEQYIDLMERVVSAYTGEKIDSYIQKTKKSGLSEHGFPRLTANLGILIAHGRKAELKDRFVAMMDLCCAEIPTALQRNGVNVGNDFSIKEIVFCLLEIEQANAVDKSITDGWRSALQTIVPDKTYSVISPTPPVRVGNWAAFGAASEEVRKYAGLGCEDDFIENQLESQLLSFDSGGMYRDPDEPMVYDLVTRLQLAVTLHFGYDGACRRKLTENLLRSADLTLQMQSVSGEIPYGGRSNQFLHNEAAFAALCEFYASLFGKKGDAKRAALFKKAAQDAVGDVMRWLDHRPVHHVKNHYDTESMYGCEKYAYFDKYMVTTGSWLYLAYLFSDDRIACPADVRGNDAYISETSPHFHKVFGRFHDYFAEIDTKADIHYDASGLGRIHKRGAPSALLLSMPFSKTPNYSLDIENPMNFSVCGGVDTPNGMVYGFDEGVVFKTVEKRVTNDFAVLRMECKKDDMRLFDQSVILSDSGVEIVAEGEGYLEIAFPVFLSDGKEQTLIIAEEKRVTVHYQNHSCTFLTNYVLMDKKMLLANRNGHYKAFSVCGTDQISLKISID